LRPSTQKNPGRGGKKEKKPGGRKRGVREGGSILGKRGEKFTELTKTPVTNGLLRTLHLTTEKSTTTKKKKRVRGGHRRERGSRFECKNHQGYSKKRRNGKGSPKKIEKKKKKKKKDKEPID